MHSRVPGFFPDISLGYFAYGMRTVNSILLKLNLKLWIVNRHFDQSKLLFYYFCLTPKMAHFQYFKIYSLEILKNIKCGLGIRVVGKGSWKEREVGKFLVGKFGRSWKEPSGVGKNPYLETLTWKP